MTPCEHDEAKARQPPACGEHRAAPCFPFLTHSSLVFCSANVNTASMRVYLQPNQAAQIASWLSCSFGIAQRHKRYGEHVEDTRRTREAEDSTLERHRTSNRKSVQHLSKEEPEHCQSPTNCSRIQLLVCDQTARNRLSGTQSKPRIMQLTDIHDRTPELSPPSSCTPFTCLYT